jgi:hypothetical protein
MKPQKIFCFLLCLVSFSIKAQIIQDTTNTLKKDSIKSIYNPFKKETINFENQVRFGIQNPTRTDTLYTVITPSTSEVKNSNVRFERTGIEIDVRQSEITIGFYIEGKMSIYKPILELNTTFNNSEDKLRISYSALYSLGYMFVGMLVGRTITGEPIDGGNQKSNNDLIWLILYSPLTLTNAEHHICILTPSNSKSAHSVGLSAFVGFRTDIFNSDWIVYSPGIGIQIDYNWGENDNISSNNSMDFQIGVEYPYEFKLKQFQEVRMFLGLKASLW